MDEPVRHTIRLDLRKHCIETAIKRRHEAAVSRYFKDEQTRDTVEKELVLLEKALAAFDFPRLRSRWPMLAGGDDRPAFLTNDDRLRPCLQVDDRCIVPPANERWPITMRSDPLHPTDQGRHRR